MYITCCAGFGASKPQAGKRSVSYVYARTPVRATGSWATSLSNMYMHVHTYVYVYICMYIYVYTSMYTYVYCKIPYIGKILP